jgi:hypothetical protein
MQADVAVLVALPPAPFDAGDKRATRVSSLPLVRYQNNDYPAPTRYGHQDVLAKGMSTGLKLSAGDFIDNALTDPSRYRLSVAHHDLSFATSKNSVLVCGPPLFLLCGAPEAASTRLCQFTRVQFWPPQTNPPNTQPSTRRLCGLFREILAV